MARLSYRQRTKLPRKDFAIKGGGRKGRYPIPDKAHARAALSRASAAKKRGKLSASQYRAIVRKADRKLGRTSSRR